MILYVLSLNKRTMERYRSGHNEAVLKTVCPKGRVGSNPTLSASIITMEPDYMRALLFFFFLANSAILSLQNSKLQLQLNLGA